MGNDVRIQGNPVTRDRRIEPQSIAENSWLQLQLVSLRMDFRATRFERAISCSQSTLRAESIQQKSQLFYWYCACRYLSRQVSIRIKLPYKNAVVFSF